jgi:hypothetical protein
VSESDDSRKPLNAGNQDHELPEAVNHNGDTYKIIHQDAERDTYKTPYQASRDPPEAVPLKTEGTSVGAVASRRKGKTYCGIRRRWLIVGIILLIVVIAAVLGGVLGSRKSSNNESVDERKRALLEK